MKTTKKILVIDLEATCWDGQVPAGQVNEIIEIGICVLDRANGSVTAAKGILVKPEHAEISPFCTHLTTITQAMLDREGVSFPEACRQLTEDYDARSYTWASYGAYDLRIMQAQCLMRGVAYPLSDGHINVKNLFARTRGMQKRIGMAGALQLLRLDLEGTHHRGVDDAKNTAKILQWCLERA